MYYTECWALALGSYIPGASSLHRPRVERSLGSASALRADFFVLPDTSIQSLSAAGNVRAVGFLFRRASGEISGAGAQRFVYAALP